MKKLLPQSWVEPAQVCNIRFTEITEDGSVCHPVFEGLRIDKSAIEVVLEKQKKRPSTK